MEKKKNSMSWTYFMLNSHAILSKCGSQTDHRKFHLVVVQNLLEISSREHHPSVHPKMKTKPTKQLNDDNSNIGQLQYSICSVTYTQSNRNIQLPSFSVKDVKLCCACICVSEFTILRFLKHGVNTPWERNSSRK